MQVWSLIQEDPLEEGMATPSSILAWRIPWMEEPGGLQSIGSHRVRHDWSNLVRTHACLSQNLIIGTVHLGSIYYSFLVRTISGSPSQNQQVAYKFIWLLLQKVCKSEVFFSLCFLPSKSQALFDLKTQEVLISTYGLLTEMQNQAPVPLP